MADQAGTLELLVRELAQGLQPLEARLAAGNAEGLIAELGLALPQSAAAENQLVTAVASTATAAGALATTLEQLITAIEADDVSQIVSAGAALIAKVRDVLNGISAVGPALDAAAGAATLTPAQKAEIQAFAADLPRKLLDLTIVDYLEARLPTMFQMLTLLGIVDDMPSRPDLTDPLTPQARIRALHLDHLTGLFLDPTAYLRDAFGFGDPAFDGTKLFPRLQSVLQDADLPAELILAPGQLPILEAYIVRLGVDPTASPPALTLRIRTSITADFEQTYPLGSLWAADVAVKGEFDEGLEAVLAPPLTFRLTPPTGALTLDVTAGLLAKRAGGTVVVFQEAGATRLEATQIGVGIGVTGSASLGSSVTIQPIVTGEFTGGHLKIDLSGGDGFISTITGGANIDANLDFKLSWSPGSGFEIEGSSAIQIAIPTHVSLGPIEVDKLYLQLGIAGGALPAELSGAFSANLGPLTASVDRIGLNVTTTFPDHGGNLGPADLQLAFKPPNGVGLSVDAGIISGGGFLYIDAEHGQYAGALQLKFADFLDLSAIGLIDTRLPDGSPGFSLLIIITADFGPGIQLGFGFTLNAVGGMLGLNRTMVFQALMDGVRNDTIESVLFPRDVVANAPRIISDLRALFPPHDGTFLIGPMAKLGWGEPTLVSLELGVIVEIPPGDIAILGVLKVALPADELAILELQVNFAGALEFDKQRAYFFASLYNSHILFLTIEGDMGLLFAWGENADFVLTVGRFSSPVQPAAAADPDPATDRGRHHQRVLRAHPLRGLLRGHHEHRAVRVDQRVFLRLLGLLGGRSLRVRRADPVLTVSLQRVDIDVVLGQGVRPRRLRTGCEPHPRGAHPVARQGQRVTVVLLLFDRHPNRHHVGRQPRHHAAAGRRDADPGRRVRQAQQLEGRPSRRLEPARVPAATRPGRVGLRPAPGGDAADQPARGAARSDDRQGRQPAGERRQPLQPQHDFRGSEQGPRPAGVLRTRAVQRLRRRDQALATCLPATGRRDRTVGVGAGLSLRHRDHADRPLRRNDHRHEASPDAPASLLRAGRRSVCPFPLRRQRSPLAALHLRQATDSPVRGRGGRLARAVRGRASLRQHRARRRRRVHQSGGGRRSYGAHGRRRSLAGRIAARAAGVRGRRVSQVASYSFLPWLRQGVANTIASADGDVSVKARAAIDVSVRLSGDPVGGGAELTQALTQNIALYGPGDIVDIDSRAIVKTEPHDWITNFEANYLPAVDFYDEDFPWRYTPAAPDGTGLKLRPWIALIVLDQTEFDPGQTGADRPLPYIGVANTDAFPPADELWAWAHVHFNQSLAASPTELVSPDMGAVLPRVQSIVSANPDLAYSRLLCPRRLNDNTAYQAFVIPTYETGRLAGLGLDPSAAPHATFSAWAGYPGRLEPTNYPYLLHLVLPHRFEG